MIFILFVALLLSINDCIWVLVTFLFLNRYKLVTVTDGQADIGGLTVADVFPIGEG